MEEREEREAPSCVCVCVVRDGRTQGPHQARHLKNVPSAVCFMKSNPLIKDIVDCKRRKGWGKTRF